MADGLNYCYLCKWVLTAFKPHHYSHGFLCTVTTMVVMSVCYRCLDWIEKSKFHILSHLHFFLNCFVYTQKEMLQKRLWRMHKQAELVGNNYLIISLFLESLFCPWLDEKPQKALSTISLTVIINSVTFLNWLNFIHSEITKNLMLLNSFPVLALAAHTLK